MDKLSLRELSFYAYHGCLPFEKEEGGWYQVDIDCFLDVSLAAQSDNLEDGVNYGEIYSLIKQEMDIPSNLIENVAWRILHSIKSKFSTIKKCSVTVTKLNPPFEGEKIDYKGAVAAVSMEL